MKINNYRDEFCIPKDTQGREKAYFCGNSLGLLPKATHQAVQAELDAWQKYAVEAHFQGQYPWMSYHSCVCDHLAELVGALPSEVVAMNSLTVNLHLMMVSFYRPCQQRSAILIEQQAFPSDRYAVESQILFHGFDATTNLIEVAPDVMIENAPSTWSSDAFIQAIHENSDRLSLILLSGVHYLTGQCFDLAEIVRVAQYYQIPIGLDLAHAVGNIPLKLHDLGVDFAVWCSYKYLNAGPGAVAGCFVHERHAHQHQPRFAGWWGHDQNTRFQMGSQFIPTPGAEGWQLSNPPILALAPLRVSLEIFHRANILKLRENAITMTNWLIENIQTTLHTILDIITPLHVLSRGCQLSLRVRGTQENGRHLFAYLTDQGIIGDWREPNIIRIAPAPLYNNLSDCQRFLDGVKQWAKINAP